MKSRTIYSIKETFVAPTATLESLEVVPFSDLCNPKSSKIIVLKIAIGLT